MFHDDLRQHQTSQVFACRGVNYLHVVPLLHHLSYLVLIDVPAVGGVVKTAVPVFLDDHSCSVHFLLVFRLTCSQKRLILAYAAMQHIVQHKN